MSPRLFAEINGQPVPLDKCDWVHWGACGCPCGVATASSYPDEESLWRDLYPLKRDRERAQRRNPRMELMTHERYSAEVYPLMLKRCPHYGQQELPGAAS